VHAKAVPGPVQTFRVDRIRRVARRRQDPVARRLPGLDSALRDGQLRFFDKGPIALRLRFAANDAGDALRERYRETPMAEDQQIVALPDGRLELRATVMYSLQLVQMLQGEAHRSYVVEPAALREELAAFLRAAVQLQAETGDS
jgi:hypothetical protein